MAERLKILLLEPFMGGSHAAWANGLQKFSRHDIQIMGMPDRHWKWRMHGGAVHLANEFLKSDLQPDIILATDMLDLSVFLGLTRKRTAKVKTILYFHENQLTYPWSKDDEDIALQRDGHYGFINYTSAMAADEIWFNSAYHQHSFLKELYQFLKAFPDYQGKESVDRLRNKSKVQYVGVDFKRLDSFQTEKELDQPPLILWNHRWEYDKNPELFFETLIKLSQNGLKFRLAVCGEQYAKAPAIFEKAKVKLDQHIIQWGMASVEKYAELLWKTDILPVTSNQDFFGISAVEAMYTKASILMPDRLAFPEHLTPRREFSWYYYSTDQQFEDYLEGYLLNPTSAGEKARLQVMRYDWSNCIDAYDADFENLVARQ